MMTSLFDLGGLNAVVIGGTSGIGRQIAIGLAQHGANVAPVGRNAEAVELVCAEIESMGRISTRLTADVRSQTSLEQLAKALSTRLGIADILVNAAGITKKQPTVEVGD